MQEGSLERCVDNSPVHSPIKEPSKKPPVNNQKSLSRDYSFQSDDGTNSVCSSVESFLEMRRPDPEEMLLELGFGPNKNNERINRIPSRFLHPSKLLPHIDIGKFLEEYGTKMNSETNSCPLSPSRSQSRSN